MALSDLAVRQAKATGKAYTLPELNGLALAATAAGGRTWHFRYYWAGKQKRMSLGTYLEVTLREARSLRDEARALLATLKHELIQSVLKLARGADPWRIYHALTALDAAGAFGTGRCDCQQSRQARHGAENGREGKRMDPAASRGCLVVNAVN